jgi:hypothetical protein
MERISQYIEDEYAGVVKNFLEKVYNPFQE